MFRSKGLYLINFKAVDVNSLIVNWFCRLRYRSWLLIYASIPDLILFIIGQSKLMQMGRYVTKYGWGALDFIFQYIKHHTAVLFVLQFFIRTEIKDGPLSGFAIYPGSLNQGILVEYFTILASLFFCLSYEHGAQGTKPFPYIQHPYATTNQKTKILKN